MWKHRQEERRNNDWFSWEQVEVEEAHSSILPSSEAKKSHEPQNLQLCEHLVIFSSGVTAQPDLRLRPIPDAAARSNPPLWSHLPKRQWVSFPVVILQNSKNKKDLYPSLMRAGEADVQIFSCLIQLEAITINSILQFTPPAQTRSWTLYQRKVCCNTAFCFILFLLRVEGQPAEKSQLNNWHRPPLYWGNFPVGISCLFDFSLCSIASAKQI